jgi:hypothetical protein
VLQDANSSVSSTFNYSKIRLFGVVPISFLISLIFVIAIKSGEKSLKLFKLFFQQYLVLMLIATFIGLFGLLFFEYSTRFFIDYFYYSSTIILVLYVFNNSVKREFYELFKKNILLALVASPISSLIFFISGVNATYGGINIIPYNSLFLFSPIILFTNFISNKIVYLISVVSITIVSVYSVGGKGVIFVLILLIASALKFIVKSKFKVIPLTGVVLVLSLIIYNISNGFFVEDKNEFLLAHKVNQFISIFNWGDLSFDSLENVSDSPRVRIAEFLNILNYYFNNPFKSIFGLGFGSYFEDNLNLFALMDLSQGSFDDDQINTGRFYRAHDTFPVILMLHGVVGLLFSIYWSFYSFRNSVKSFFLLGLIPWLFLTYGFDINIAITGIIFLYIGLYELNVYESSKHFNENNFDNI